MAQNFKPVISCSGYTSKDNYLAYLNEFDLEDSQENYYDFLNQAENDFYYDLEQIYDALSYEHVLASISMGRCDGNTANGFFNDIEEVKSHLYNYDIKEVSKSEYIIRIEASHHDGSIFADIIATKNYMEECDLEEIEGNIFKYIIDNDLAVKTNQII